ncbi:hypothetical protein C8R44DRAFT_737744 [Mycena epipterygia]|nr:hypothetical protein C8R44DRAFT_737744 [Mycena epipterygia]
MFITGIASIAATLFLCIISAPISITHRAVEPCILAATVYVALVRIPGITNDPIYSWLPLLSIHPTVFIWNDSLRKAKLESRCWEYYLAIRSVDESVGASTAGKTTEGGASKRILVAPLE